MRGSGVSEERLPRNASAVFPHWPDSRLAFIALYILKTPLRILDPPAAFCYPPGIIHIFSTSAFAHTAFQKCGFHFTGSDPIR